jgi:hypothetical protein
VRTGLGRFFQSAAALWLVVGIAMAVLPSEYWLLTMHPAVLIVAVPLIAAARTTVVVSVIALFQPNIMLRLAAVTWLIYSSITYMNPFSHIQGGTDKFIVLGLIAASLVTLALALFDLLRDQRS